jgi:hypothetical protein
MPRIIVVLCLALTLGACESSNPVPTAFAATPAAVSAWPSPVGEAAGQVFEYH